MLWIITPLLPNWGVVPPKSCLGGCGTIEGMIPFVQWVNNLIDILRNYEIFGFFTFREFTRSIANLIDVIPKQTPIRVKTLGKMCLDLLTDTTLNLFFFCIIFVLLSFRPQ